MQRTYIIFACFFIWAATAAQQYPFVHYSPKDGLISNKVRNIYQDSKGRLYFTSLNGLSVYDGARFSNYTSKNGLDNDIVNCVMEMGDDSVWIITNSARINCLVNGKIKPVLLKDSEAPIINSLYRDDKGILYAATDQGLYFFEGGRFIKLPFTDVKGENINTYIASIIPVGRYMLVRRDNSLLRDERSPLYLYDKETQKITAKAQKIFAINKAPDGRIWVSTEKNIMSVDTTELKKGKIVLKELDGIYDKVKKLGKYFITFGFDPKNNCWLGDQSSVLIKADTNGKLTPFTTASGLNMVYIDVVFTDREGTVWIATNNAGLHKLVHNNFSFMEGLYGLASVTELSYAADKDQLLFYSYKNAKAITVKDNIQSDYFRINNANEINRLIETPMGIYGIWKNAVYKMIPSGNALSPKIILSDTTYDLTSGYLVDKNGNLLLCGNNNLAVILNGTTIYRKKINGFVDQAALDARGNIWMASRSGQLFMYQAWPDDLANYLEQKYIFTKELSGIAPRSITIDKEGNIWIGTREEGLHSFSLRDGVLTPRFHLTTVSGLSENFISYLACDEDNNIWACTPTGLDKITVRKGVPVIENLTKQNNIYQSVYKVVIDKNNTAWGLVSNGLIRITAQDKPSTGYSPTLMVSMIKAGKDTITPKADASLSHQQNNLSFYFAATSFLDEKQVLYSYQLEGGSNNQWSEPSNSPTVSFIDLPPGDYVLNIKAIFPAGRYPEQSIQYHFSILPPWWQTWWLRSIAGLFIIGLLIIAIRFYYRRKLEKKLAVVEKQQAIEKERTRIATDMHDDLGAGLSRIKFLSQALGNKNPNDESIKTALQKITDYSDEMTEKMGEIVWALNEKNDTLADLVAYTRSYVMEYLANHDIPCEANTPMHLPGSFIPGEIRRNIFLAVKECLHNIVKHANASQVYFSVELNGKIRIIIHDNGKGIDWNNQRPYSNGLQNIQKRLAEIKGEVDFVNENGTKVLLEVPLSL